MAETAVSFAARPWYSPAVLVAFAAVVFGSVWLAVLGPAGPPADDSPEAGFARDMSTHHAQAVEMAEIVRDRTEAAELRVLTADIALTQQAQIGQMFGWLAAWRLPPTGSEEPLAWAPELAAGHDESEHALPGMASGEEIDMLRALPVSDAETLFMQLMIEHHTAGISMAEAALDATTQPEVETLARAIAQSQQAEVNALRDLLAARGFDAPEETHHESAESGAAHAESEGHHGEANGGLVDGVIQFGGLVLVGLGIGWLGADVTAGGRPDRSASTELSRLVAITGLTASAVLHAALTSAHLEESVAFGVFFGASAVVLAACAGALACRPDRAVAVAGGAISVLLIVVWAVFRLIPPPGTDEPEAVDFVGVATKATEVIAIIGCAALLRKPIARAAQALAGSREGG